VVTCNARDKFLLAKSTKKVFRRVNFTNLKTSGGYIIKSKPQEVCLQLSQILGGDYAIWLWIIEWGWYHNNKVKKKTKAK
jgi:hypothetical protein